MAVLNSIFKCIKHIKTENGYQKVSEWQTADMVECSDGTNLETKIQALQSNSANISNEINSLKKSVADGKKLLAGTISNVIHTAADATFAAMNSNIASAFVSQYNRGVTDADARVNASSANYKAGYNAGVTAADNRANVNSVNYQTGYNNGFSAGAAGKITVYTGTASVWVSKGGNNQTIAHPAADNFAIRVPHQGRKGITYVGNTATYGTVWAEGAGMEEGYVDVPWVAW